MIVLTPEKNLSKGMQWFMKSLSSNINQQAGRINQLWGSRFYRSQIKSPLYYLHAYKYVYTNPLKAGIADNILNYKYSSLPGLIGKSKLVIPIVENTISEMGVTKCIDWLNKLPDDSQWNIVQKALKKTEFKLILNRPNRKPLHSLEQELF